MTELSRQVDELADGDLLRQQVTDTADRVNMMDQVGRPGTVGGGCGSFAMFGFVSVLL